ncbi:MAG: hypothetical protein A2W90_12470 [Bacteroidetes bacterium GWF2_42_66]|nr:MAG: hypothetical protein A2W92_22955 [Bacteroidetes bacterium GWA2_42_15]OFY00203.1 MAG: hypothetical protein A2W89_17455 [Bacteroidetes bacterium GWE2_42_39]OFY40343.1 MAG: hypothetical protein A2W90_12470 [Bacteroidetes bacterium GWF2_42_66]
MLRRAVYIVFLLLFSKVLLAQSPGESYHWIEFTDKNGTEYSIDQPKKFLSQRAIDRRKRQNIEIDETDLPVSKAYTDSLQSMGFMIMHTSKWLNGCTIASSDPMLINQLSKINFISSFQLSKPAIQKKSAIIKFEKAEIWKETIDSTYYGASLVQIAQMNGLTLHQQGFRGKGLHIAVLDNGFLNSNQIAAFDSLWLNERIAAFRDFVNPGGNVFQEGGHGTNVLSAMGACLPQQLIGTAPDASYYLLRTEDDGSEYIIEEDNWVAGAEYADSLGADIVNSSLGYAFFDDPSTDHTYADMDGQTTRVTKAANMASAKGILVCNSAGNEGNKSWHYIIAPSDGDRVMAVGAVDSKGAPASFTSFGPASDGDIKPNVSAMGVSAALTETSGEIVRSNGTSFSSPLLAGMAACLWQAFPHATSAEIKEAIEQSGSLFASPDNRLGYGIPDFGMAMYLLLKKYLPDELKNADWHVFPNPISDRLQILWLHEKMFSECRVQLISTRGNLSFDRIFPESSRINLSNLANLPSGLLILKLTSEEKTTTFKIVKR